MKSLFYVIYSTCKIENVLHNDNMHDTCEKKLILN